MINNPRLSPKSQFGFTLIELMLVVLLIGLASSIVLATIDDSKQKKAVKRAAHKIAALSSIALDQAVLKGRDYGMVLTDNKYHFVELFEQRWRAVEDIVLKEQTLDGISMTAEIEGFQWLPDQTDYSSTALFTEREVDLELDEQEKPNIPQLLILSSGEMTPFKLTLSLDDEKIFDLREDEQEYFVTIKANTLGLLNVTDSNDEEQDE